uniref:BRCT domain-containing protein n=1 Tax=Tetraodon nigroviridis TaxID=99883 RepID=H3DQA8_TETNG
MSREDNQGFIVKFVECKGQKTEYTVKAYEAILGLQSEKYVKAVDEDAILQMDQKDKSLYVFSSFATPAYLHCKMLGCRIVSPLVVLFCLQQQHSCIKLTRVEVMDLVQLMGGRQERLVARNIYLLGEISIDSFSGITELPVEEYLCPVVCCGCTVCVTGLSSTERKEVQRLCEQHGANYTGQLKMNECTHLIVREPTGQMLTFSKYECARKWNVYAYLCIGCLTA